MRTKAWIAGFVCAFASAAQVFTAEVGFTAAGGYSDGWFDGQNGWVSDIETTGMTTWAVDSTKAGSISVSFNFIGAVYGGTDDYFRKITARR